MPLPLVREFTFATKEPLHAYEVATLRQFVTEVRDDTLQLNGLVKKYNNTRDETKSVALLEQIYQTQQRMQSKYPPALMTKCPEYELINQEVLTNLTTEFAAHGIRSLPKEFVSTTYPSSPAPALAAIINVMPPQKINEMVGIIIRAVNEEQPFDISALRGIYAPGEPEHEEFDAFLSSHQCRLISKGNSINLQITDENSDSYLLKIETNRSTAPQLELELRNRSLNSTLTSVFSERSGSMQLGSHSISGTVWLGEWCEKGNLLAESSRHQSDDEKARSAIEIYRQMGHALQNIGRERCAFPDMKNENWLLTGSGFLRISDAKSIAHAPGDKFNYYDFEYAGKYKGDEGNFQNHWHDFLESRHMRPPEFNRPKINGRWDPAVEVGPAHAYMLGKNLYQYLTGCSNGYLQANPSYETLDFSAPIFATAQGKALKSIVTNLIRTEPDKRMTVERATQLLEKMQPQQQQDCRALLSEIQNKCSFGEKDRCVQEYIDIMHGRIIEADRNNDLALLENIKNELEQTLRTVAPVIQEVKRLTDTLRDRLIARGSKEKADNIDATMRMIPLLDRATIDKGDSDNAREVLRLMAAPRFSTKSVLLADGSIDESKAAETFKQFKSKMSLIRQSNVDAVGEALLQTRPEDPDDSTERKTHNVV